ncbi:MAG: ATP-binding protein [bacterium]|nr:ATP-binding protein [bacterium]
MLPNRPSTEPLRIYMVGAHATGKTTLARWVRDRYGIPMIAEVARGVLAEMEARLETLRTDIALVNRYQREVFARQIEAEHNVKAPFVSDRAFCNLAYAAHHSTILGEVFRDPRLKEYMHWVRGGVVFYLRPHQELVVPDGVRAGLTWEDVVRIDGMVKLMLEMFDVPYIPVESLSMQERVRLVERVLGLTELEATERGASELGGTQPGAGRGGSARAGEPDGQTHDADSGPDRTGNGRTSMSRTN